MIPKVMFKTTAFGGFEKQAVLNYIMQLNKSTEEAQAQMNDQLRAAADSHQQVENSLQEAQATIQRLQQELSSRENDLTAERRRTAELTATVERLNSELAQGQQIILQKEAETREAQRVSMEMSERNRELESRRLEIEQASAQIGKLVVDARTEAEQVLAAAQAEVQTIRARAQMEAQESLMQTTSRAREMEQNARQAMEAVSGQISRFRAEVNGIQTTVVEAMAMMQDRMQSVGVMMDGVEAEFSSALRAASSEPMSLEPVRLEYQQMPAPAPAAAPSTPSYPEPSPMQEPPVAEEPPEDTDSFFR